MGFKTSILAIQGHEKFQGQSCSIEVQVTLHMASPIYGVHRLVRISPFDSLDSVIPHLPQCLQYLTVMMAFKSDQ